MDTERCKEIVRGIMDTNRYQVIPWTEIPVAIKLMKLIEEAWKAEEEGEPWRKMGRDIERMQYIIDWIESKLAAIEHERNLKHDWERRHDGKEDI